MAYMERLLKMPDSAIGGQVLQQLLSLVTVTLNDPITVTAAVTVPFRNGRCSRSSCLFCAAAAGSSPGVAPALRAICGGAPSCAPAARAGCRADGGG